VKTAIVLSGGGAHGDFEVGALRYLYNRGLYAQIICGSSVGAINGVKLAEGGDYLSEGVAGYVYDAPTPESGELFRMVHPNTGDHFYTTSGEERQNAIDNLGYVYEGIACFVLMAATPGTIPLYRLRNPSNGDHFYTASIVERDFALYMSALNKLESIWLDMRSNK
jgi:hypothetical protein